MVSAVATTFSFCAKLITLSPASRSVRPRKKLIDRHAQHIRAITFPRADARSAALAAFSRPARAGGRTHAEAHPAPLRVCPENPRSGSRQNWGRSRILCLGLRIPLSRRRSFAIPMYRRYQHPRRSGGAIDTIPDSSMIFPRRMMTANSPP